jgi:hypothetical protein
VSFENPDWVYPKENIFHSSHGCWESFRLRFATLPLACLGHALLTRAKP